MGWILLAMWSLTTCAAACKKKRKAVEEQLRLQCEVNSEDARKRGQETTKTSKQPQPKSAA
jgi:hypothetical protein